MDFLSPIRAFIDIVDHERLAAAASRPSTSAAKFGYHTACRSKPGVQLRNSLSTGDAISTCDFELSPVFPTRGLRVELNSRSIPSACVSSWSNWRKSTQLRNTAKRYCQVDWDHCNSVLVTPTSLASKTRSDVRPLRQVEMSRAARQFPAPRQIDRHTPSFRTSELSIVFPESRHALRRGQSLRRAEICRSLR